MALMQKHKQEKNYVEIPNKTAKAPEKRTPEQSISLQALGLIVNLWSYDIEKWELHKTELYNRFTSNKETSVNTAWTELVEAKYILEYKVRVGKKNDYVYIYNIVPFTNAEIEEYNIQVLDTYGHFSRLDFPDLKNKTSNSGPQNQVSLNKEKEIQDFMNEKNNNKKFKDNYQSISQDVINIAAKIFVPEKNEVVPERLNDIVNVYFYFHDKLTLMDMQRILFQVKKAESKNKINDFKSYLWMAFTKAIEKYENAETQAKKLIRKEEIPEYWNKKPEQLSVDEIEAKRKEIEEILKDFKK